MRAPTTLLLGLSTFLLAASPLHAQGRVPGESWARFQDPAEAGFDPERLEAARRSWEKLDSSAFLVIADGAVVAAWGEVERRFMCHSVRKSFLSGLYGIYWDRGELELNKSLADLGIEDEPSPLLEAEKRARILDLLKARSGVFHPAAYAGRTDSRPRGSEGPGRFFAYNNWDFNTLATILEMETGASVFEAFDEHFGAPLGMQDWRVSDGYFHYELDKSKYPAYPFRLSARDAARFGLLFARGGDWGGQRILSEHWVQRSSALYSIDSEVMGYGFMWWVMREPRFLRHGMYAALGVGNQLIAVLPKSDLVIVNRANTYEGERTPTGPLLDLIESILQARTGVSVEEPGLAPLDSSYSGPALTELDPEELEEYAGSWSFPAPALGLQPSRTIEVSIDAGHLRLSSPNAGVFRLYAQADGSFKSEDSHNSLLVIRDERGRFLGFSDPDAVALQVLTAMREGDMQRAEAMLEQAGGAQVPVMRVSHLVLTFLTDDPERAEAGLNQLTTKGAAVDSILGGMGERCAEQEDLFLAQTLLELNTRVNPRSASAWRRLAEAHRLLGDQDAAEDCLGRASELEGDDAAGR